MRLSVYDMIRIGGFVVMVIGAAVAMLAGSVEMAVLAVCVFVAGGGIYVGAGEVERM